MCQVFRKMKTVIVLVLVSLASGELAPSARYVPLVPNAVVGQGYNPGSSHYQEYNQGYNQGYQGGFSPVAFTATRAAYIARRGKLVLEKTITNLGGGWNGRTGEFVAPSSGTYYFSWSALSAVSSPLQLGLMRNDIEMASSWADRSGYQTASGSAVLTLRRGDNVHLEVLDGQVHEPRQSSRGYATFTGHRVG